MPKLETLELEIVQKSKTSTAGVKNLAEALSNLAKAGEAAGNLSKTSDALTGIASAAGGLKEASAGIRSVANAMRKLGDSLDEAPGAVGGLQKIAAALQKISEAASGISGVGADIRAINRAAKDAGKIPGTSGGSNGLPTAGDDIVDGEASGALDETTKKAEETQQSVGEATDSVYRFKDALRSLGKGALSIGKSLGKRMLGNFTKDIKSAVSTMGNLFSSFKRIAMYRGLRTAIKAITQGFATGVKHLYAWADLVGNNFKQSMDSLSTSMNYMKNSLGAMVSPIIDALAPAVDILVDKFVDLINVVNQFLATITGASSWRRAVKEQKEYADETDKAAGAQKRLNHQLMAFDELNNITVNQPSSRGSGNKDDEVTDGSFVVEQLPDWAKDIREAIDNGMWKTAGTLLAQKLNGLIDDWDANAFGKKLGEKFQNGIDAYLGFMKTFKWNQLGIKAADFINGILSNVNPSDLGEAIVQKFNAAVGFLNGFAKTLNWDEVGTWCVDVLFGAINGIQWETLGDTIGTIISGISTMIISAFNELLEHPGDIVDAVTGFFKGLFEGLWGEDGEGVTGLIKVAGLILGFKALWGSVFADWGLKGIFKAAFSSGVTNGASEALAAGGTVETGVKSLIGSFAERLGTIALVIGFTWFITSSGGFKTPTPETFSEELFNPDNPAATVGQWIDDMLGTGYSDEWKQAFKKALLNDESVRNAFNTELGQLGTKYVGDQGAANAGALEAAIKAFDRKYKFSGAEEHDRGYKDPTAGWVDYNPNIDSTQQVSAINAISDAAIKARQHVHEMPPTDDEVSTFVDNAIKMAGDKGAAGVGSAASTAKSKVKQLPPSEDEVSIFTTRLKKERDGVDLIKTAAKYAGSAVKKIELTKGQANGFKNTMTTWNTKLTGIAESSRKAKKAIGEVPTSKKFTFTDAGNGLKNAASRAKTTLTQLNGLQSKYTFTVKSDTLGDKADEAERLYKNLNNINSKSWRIQVTGDMKLKMTSERGNTMYFVEPYATGGFPETGQLFVASEAGPELIGTVNGKNAVASNGEITGIADAVYNTGEEEATLLREQNQLLRQLLAKNTNISLAPNVAAGRWVAQASNAYRKATGG